MSRVSVILPLAPAEPVVAEIRSRYDWTASVGIPAHVTLLGGTGNETPDADRLDELVPSLERICLAIEPFQLDLVASATWTDAAVLLAEATESLLRLGESLARVAGLVARDAFHMTVARGADRDELLAIAASLLDPLPIRCTAHEVLVLEHGGVGEPVTQRITLPLGAGAARAR